MYDCGGYVICDIGFPIKIHRKEFPIRNTCLNTDTRCKHKCLCYFLELKQPNKPDIVEYTFNRNTHVVEAGGIL